MSLEDFLNWRADKEEPKRTRPVHRPPLKREPPREEPAAPSEPVTVHEFDGSTTIVQRIRSAIAKRFEGG
jgi:hypothetical protein